MTSGFSLKLKSSLKGKIFKTMKEIKENVTRHVYGNPEKTVFKSEKTSGINEMPLP